MDFYYYYYLTSWISSKSDRKISNRDRILINDNQLRLRSHTFDNIVVGHGVFLTRLSRMSQFQRSVIEISLKFLIKYFSMKRIDQLFEKYCIHFVSEANYTLSTRKTIILKQNLKFLFHFTILKRFAVNWRKWDFFFHKITSRIWVIQFDFWETYTCWSEIK